MGKLPTGSFLQHRVYVVRSVASCKSSSSPVCCCQSLDAAPDVGPAVGAATFDGFIDLGKQLSVLHTLLKETLESLTQVTSLHGVTSSCTIVKNMYLARMLMHV